MHAGHQASHGPPESNASPCFPLPLPLTRHCREALNGTGRFQGACTGVRAETVKAGMLFYPILYFYHEIDAAIKTMRGIAAGTAPAAARDPLYSGLGELGLIMVVRPWVTFVQ